jgi:hypothetical protein
MSKQQNNPNSRQQSTNACSRTPAAGNFPLEVLPATVQQLVLDLKSKSPLHPSMIAMGAMTTIATAIGRKLSTQLSTIQETTPCNIYTVLGTDSTSGKSILGTVCKPMLTVQERQQQAHSDACCGLEVEYDLSLIGYKGLLKQISSLPTPEFTTDLQAKAAKLKQHIKRLKCRIQRSPELCLLNPTGAAVKKALANGDQSLYLFSLDGESFLEEAFSSKDKLLKKFLLSGHTGEYSGAETATAVTYRGKPLISLLCATQPHMLNALIQHQKAVLSGMINRLIVLNGEFLEELPLRPPSLPALEIQAGWQRLIEQLTDFRFSDSPPIVIPWHTKAEAIFDQLNSEVASLLTNWPNDDFLYFGRTKEVAVRIAGSLLAVEFKISGKDPNDPAVQGEVASRATRLMKWLVLHHIQVQSASYERLLLRLADDLEEKIRRSKGILRLSRIKDSHTHIHRELEAILARFPERFSVISEPANKPGVTPKAVVMKSRSFGLSA